MEMEMEMLIHRFPNHKLQTLSKLKEFADNNYELNKKRVGIALNCSPKSISSQNEFDICFGSIEQKLWTHI